MSESCLYLHECSGASSTLTSNLRRSQLRCPSKIVSLNENISRCWWTGLFISTNSLLTYVSYLEQIWLAWLMQKSHLCIAGPTKRWLIGSLRIWTSCKWHRSSLPLARKPCFRCRISITWRRPSLRSLYQHSRRTRQLLRVTRQPISSRKAPVMTR